MLQKDKKGERFVIFKKSLNVEKSCFEYVFIKYLLKRQLTHFLHVSNNKHGQHGKKVMTQDFLTQYSIWTLCQSCSFVPKFTGHWPQVPHSFLQNSTLFLHQIYAYLHVIKKSALVIKFVLQVCSHCILFVPAIIDLQTWVSDWSQMKNRTIWERFSGVMWTKLSTCFLKLTCSWAQMFNKSQCETCLNSKQVKKGNLFFSACDFHLQVTHT